MTKIGVHDFIDIIDIKNTRLSHTFLSAKVEQENVVQYFF